MVLQQNTKATDIQVIPQPNKIMIRKGEFQLKQNTTIAYKGGEDAKAIALKLAEMLNRSSGFKFSVTKSRSTKSSIIFELGKQPLNDESYFIQVKSTQMIVKASSSHGLFNGLQTLRQLFPATIESRDSTPTHWSIPCLEIEDSPRYAYRGLHLDVSSHFFDKKFVMKYIDMMAMYKFNKFHWHLTDDQGWRIQIKKHPLLTRTSASRIECDGDTIRGFYAQEDIKEVVTYAAERFVEVIPEIDYPTFSE